MKFKFNWRLTLFLVSLFVGLLLVILGNKINYCLSFGFILMGISLGFYAMFSTENYKQDEAEIQEEINSLETDDIYGDMELNKIKKKVTKKRRNVNFVFCLAGVLLIVLVFLAL